MGANSPKSIECIFHHSVSDHWIPAEIELKIPRLAGTELASGPQRGKRVEERDGGMRLLAEAIVAIRVVRKIAVLHLARTSARLLSSCS